MGRRLLNSHDTTMRLTRVEPVHNSESVEDGGEKGGAREYERVNVLPIVRSPRVRINLREHNVDPAVII